jgi:hypothetical protein
MSSSSLKYGLPLALLLLIGGQLLTTAWPDLVPATLQERRQPAAFPEIRLDYLDPVPHRVEDWYQDTWSWRAPFVRFSSWLNYRGFGRSPLPDKALIGKEGWLFRGGMSLDLVRGKLRFTQGQLRQLQRELETRRDSVAARGGQYYLAIAPLKGRIYPEYLPDNVRILNPENATDQLLRHLRENSTIDYIDLREPLYRAAHSAEAGDTLLYYLTDHHWSPAGALYAGRELLRRLARDFPGVDTLRRADYSFQLSTWGGMILAQQIGLEDQFAELGIRRRYRPSARARRVPRPDYAPPPQFPFPDDFVWDYRSDRPGQPTIFVNRESFANDLAPILNEHFRRAFYYFDDWNHDLNGEVYAREGGDIYLQLVWESMIGKLLGEACPPDFEWE